MANSNNQSYVDRQYLKTMGIDLWVDKRSVSQFCVQESQTVKSAPVSKPNSSLHKVLKDMSAIELVATIGTIKLTCSEPVRAADLLVITEGSDLTGECRQLLESMFKAIELETSQWFHAGICLESDLTSGQKDGHASSEKSVMSVSGGASLISEIETSVNPKALVMLLRTGGSTTALNALRGLRHQSGALQSFCVVSFHPQDLLDNPDAKRPAWEDLKQLRQWLS